MRERLFRWLALKVPRDLAYWCAIRVGCEATGGEFSKQEVPSLLYVDALKRWEKGPR